MDLHGFLGLSDPLGFLICLVGFSSQVWLARRHKKAFVATLLVSVVWFAIFLSLNTYPAPRRPRLISNGLREWIVSVTQIWCLAITAVSIAFQIRARIPAFNHERRHFLKTSTAAICVAPAAVAAFGILNRKNHVVREVELKIPSLPRDLENVRLVQLSDIHLGNFFSEKDLSRVVDAANELRGDIAVITGDLISVGSDPLDACLRQLSRLKNTSGIWGCMGNHESFAGVESYTQSRGASLGINFLRSKAVGLKFGKNTLNLAGVDYQRMHSSYLTGAEDLVESDQFNVLLSHNPDVFPTASEKGFDLVLAGHTHGGQVNVEILDQNLNVAEFFTKYTKGLYTRPDSAIYVNSGLGTIGMPVRLGSPAEITLIKLCAS